MTATLRSSHKSGKTIFASLPWLGTEAGLMRAEPTALAAGPEVATR